MNSSDDRTPPPVPATRAVTVPGSGKKSAPAVMPPAECKTCGIMFRRNHPGERYCPACVAPLVKKTTHEPGPRIHRGSEKYYCEWCTRPETETDPDTGRILSLEVYAYRETTGTVQRYWRICQACVRMVKGSRGSVPTLLRCAAAIAEAAALGRRLGRLEQASGIVAAEQGVEVDAEVVG